MLYRAVVRPILFSFPPEFIHNRITAIGEELGKISLGRKVVRSICAFEHPSLETEVCGLKLQNPIGLSAGFDKDVRLTQIIPDVGFGFMEAGAVTRWPSPGNPGRRLLRLPADQSLIVYYGLNNIGAEAVCKKARTLQFRIPTGINIAKTNRADIRGDQSVADYVATYRMLAPLFSYATINISCPNAQDGCTFQDNTELLEKFLAALEREPKIGPVFLKISNHLDEAGADKVLAAAERHATIDGFIISNLSKDRSQLQLKTDAATLAKLPHGGISGRPIQERSNALIRYVYRKSRGRYAIIGVGGVFTAEDAYRKIKAGASLVQLITGLIYGGPLVIKKIKKGLVELLERDGYRHVSEAVGKDAA